MERFWNGCHWSNWTGGCYTKVLFYGKPSRLRKHGRYRQVGAMTGAAVAVGSKTVSDSRSNCLTDNAGWLRLLFSPGMSEHSGAKSHAR